MWIQTCGTEGQAPLLHRVSCGQKKSQITVIVYCWSYLHGHFCLAVTLYSNPPLCCSFSSPPACLSAACDERVQSLILRRNMMQVKARKQTGYIHYLLSISLPSRFWLHTLEQSAPRHKPYTSAFHKAQSNEIQRGGGGEGVKDREALRWIVLLD